MIRSKEEITGIVKNIGYILLYEYIPKKGNRRVVIRDSIGYKYDVTLSSLLQGYVPDIVNKNNPFSLENISLWLSLNRLEFELYKNNVYRGNSKKLKFFHNSPRCQEYFEMGWNSIRAGQNCSVCAGYQTGKYNNLAYLRPDLAEEWNYERNELRPEEVTVSSGKKVWWICKTCDFDNWYAKISDRKNGNGCPACSNPPKVITDRNRLSTRFPQIAAEWHPTKNGDLTPDDLSFGSGIKVWWLCSKGHEYFSSIGNRTKGKGCQQCSNERQESVIAAELKKYLVENYNAEKEYKTCINPKTGYYLPFDIYIPAGDNPELNGYYIEVHWDHHYEISRWHNLQAKKNETTPEYEFEYQKKKDRMKRRFAKQNGTYIEIDLRKIKTTEKAIEYIENISNNK